MRVDLAVRLEQVRLGVARERRIRERRELACGGGVERGRVQLAAAGPMIAARDERLGWRARDRPRRLGGWDRVQETSLGEIGVVPLGRLVEDGAIEVDRAAGAVAPLARATLPIERARSICRARRGDVAERADRVVEATVVVSHPRDAPSRLANELRVAADRDHTAVLGDGVHASSGALGDAPEGVVRVVGDRVVRRLPDDPREEGGGLVLAVAVPEQRREVVPRDDRGRRLGVGRGAVRGNCVVEAALPLPRARDAA